jgi:hypothetical protein
LKFLKYLIVIFSFSVLSFTPIKNSSKVFTTNCEETFHFFFLTKGEIPTFWIGLDVSGECISSHLIQISINNSTITVSSSELKKYKKWDCIPELSSTLNTFEESSIKSNDNAWISKGIKITAPEYDSTLAKEFNSHVMKGGSNAYTWYKEKGDNYGLLLPEFEGLKTELLYKHKRGLYFNYKISEVHFFLDNYLLVFTHQPRIAVGADSMHGFFIFRIKKDA